MNHNMYNWGRLYAAIEHFLPQPFSRITLERLAQAPMYYFSKWFEIAKQNKNYDCELIGNLISCLPSNGGVPTPTAIEDRDIFYIGMSHQHREMCKHSGKGNIYDQLLIS